MSESAVQPEFAECFQFPEALRLLWEGTQKALEDWGMDRSDLASLCAIVVRLADHRLLLIASKGSPPGSEQVADQVRLYRTLAADMLRLADTPPAEPDWGAVAAKLHAAGAAPLDFPARLKE